MTNYRKLLGIKEASPDHYRLLSIDRFESDSDMIANAADRQMVYLRTLRTPGAEQLLNEVSAARVLLLNPAKKQEYDRALLGPPGECKLDPAPLKVEPQPPGECKLDPVLAEVAPRSPGEPSEDDILGYLFPEFTVTRETQTAIGNPPTRIKITEDRKKQSETTGAHPWYASFISVSAIAYGYFLLEGEVALASISAVIFVILSVPAFISLSK